MSALLSLCACLRAAASPSKTAALAGGRLARAGFARVLSRSGRTRRDADRTARGAGAPHRGSDLRDPHAELGVGLQSDKSADEYVRLAQAAEDGGFDVVS